MNDKVFVTLVEVSKMLDITLLSTIKKLTKHKIKPAKEIDGLNYYDLNDLNKINIAGDYTIGIVINNIKAGRGIKELNSKYYGISYVQLKKIYYNTLNILRANKQVTISDFKGKSCIKCVWSTKATNRIYYCPYRNCIKERVKC
ncbi:MAG: hypothetical protein ACOC2W_02540 [bacterium]